MRTRLDLQEAVGRTIEAVVDGDEDGERIVLLLSGDAFLALHGWDALETLEAPGAPPLPCIAEIAGADFSNPPRSR